MSEIGKIAICSVCGKEKKIFYGWSSGSLKQEKQYCKECYDYSKERVECKKCGRKVAREDKADHDRDYHSEI
jgi:hypothetical protein